MSLDSIRTALGCLQEDPDNEKAWNDLTEGVTSPDTGANGSGEIERLLGLARAQHERRREWGAVARLLDIELSFAAGTPVEAPMQAELARIYHEELADAERAAGAFRRLLQVRPDDAQAVSALEDDEAKRAKWRDLVARYLKEAEGASEPAFKSALLTSAADVLFRYGRGSDEAIPISDYLEQALTLDRKNRRAAALAEMIYGERRDWENVARIQELILMEAASKDDRIAAGLRLGRTAAKRLEDRQRAIRAYQMVLDLEPGQKDALTFLAEAYSAAGAWDELVALYDDQLRGGAVRPADELGILVQIAMVHWRMRDKPAAAEPYFDRVRRADPAHAGMLSFFREVCTARGDKARLVTILTDAQRATTDPKEKRALATEIAKIAESQENAHKAIEQYKSVLRADPDNREARDALKRLYTQTESYNALIELYRQDLERTPASDTKGRADVLREIAAIYRDRLKNDAALVTVLTQIVQLDETDVDAVRELTRLYESLGRWRDLLASQQRLAELSQNPVEKANLYRSAARRWIDQFSNVQNAITAYEALLEVEPTDGEAIAKLKELYTKRRNFAQLYALYERQLPSAEGAAKVELLMEMSKLAAERLDRGADAIALQKQILEIDPSAPGVFDALEKQAEREKDYATLAEVLEKRAEASGDTAVRLAVLQKLGAVYADRLKDVAATTRTWRRVLELSPGHARALRVLREAYAAAGDWDGLEELYASQNDWEGLADYLSTAADKATDPAVKVDVSFRAARVFEEKLGAPERSARSYERVLSVSPKDQRAAAALVPIYEKEEKWARLPALYEVLLEAAEGDQALALLRKLAAVTGGPLADKQGALAYARRAYELAPDSEGLELLEAWSRASGSWTAFVEAVEARLRKKKGLSQQLRRTLRLKLAELYARELGKIDEAVLAYKDLVETDPTDLDTIAALDALLRANQRRDDLRWLFELRVEQVTGEARAALYEEWATLEEEVFGDTAEAAALYRKVVELAPRRGDALRALARLLRAGGDFAGAAEILERHRDVSEGEDRAAREVELATTYLDHLDRPKDAYEACVRALELVSHHSEAIAILSRLVERPETRVLAARVLEAEYAEAGDARREAQALRVMLDAETDPPTRRELYAKLCDVEERKLSAAGTAFDVVLKALLEFPADLEMWDRAASLASKSGRPTDLAEAYRLHLVGAARAEVKLPESVEIELCDRAAKLHDEQLGDPEGAMPYLERVLAVDPTNDGAFARLKQILTTAERWGELESLYDRAAQGTTDQAARIELLNEVALVAEEIIGDPSKAIGYYERILALDPLYPAALDALEKLYEREQKWKELAALLERRLEAATEQEGAAYKLTLGRIYLDRLLVPERALDHLEDVLRVRQNDLEAQQLVERMLEIGSLRQRAARVLEAVYEAKDEIRKLVRVLDVRREGAETDDERRDLLRRIALLRDERLKDDAGAFAALAELCPLEPDDASARERLTQIGRRLGEHEKVASVLTASADNCLTPSTRGDILMEVARIWEDLLGDTERAEAVYRRVVEIDPNDAMLVVPAARSLARIYGASNKSAELAEILRVEVRLEDDVETRRQLYERIGSLYEDVLDDPEKAIEAYKARLSDEPTDATALAALERLYEKTEAWRDLVGVLHVREQSTLDQAERRRTLIKSAEVLSNRIGDVPEAIAGWRAVLDELGPERPTLAALASLYEKAERWQDLAETLDVDLSLVEDDPAAKLDLLTRLGDVRRSHLDDLPGALEAYRQALALDPTSARSRAALEALLDSNEAKRDAAEILHPLYEADGDAEKLLRVLEIEIETSDDPTERLEKLEKALRTAEGPLGDAKRAFDYAVRGVRQAVGESDIGKWIDTIERLAETTGRWAELCQLYHETAHDILDGEVQQNVELRVGELYRTKLGDKARSIEHYKKALAAKSDDRRAMIALEELYEEQDDTQALLEILKLRVDAALDDHEKKQLAFRVAELQRKRHGDLEGAIATYEAILDVSLEPSAIAALEELYAATSRHGDLVRLYERQLDEGVGSAADLRVKIAKAAHEHLGDTSRAFDELAEALAAEPAHAGAVAELESILKTPEGSDSPFASAEHKARAAEMLEPVYLKRADWARVKECLEARLAASRDPVDRRELLTRLATLHEEQLEDYKAALETVARMLHEDLADEGTWSELERLAKVAGAERRLAEIYGAELEALAGDDAQTAKLCRRTGEIWADLGEIDAALVWYRRAHAFEPESRELFQAIDRLLVKQSRHAERVELYRAALDYLGGDERLSALHTIARLERFELGSPEKAVETYRAALDVDDNDARALDALTELYRELGQDRDLADLYLRRAEAASSPEVGAPFRLSLAQLLRTRLGDVEGAIDQLQTIVADVPWHEGAIAELESLTSDEAHKARVVEILRPLYERSDDWRQLVRLNEDRYALAQDTSEKVAVLRETAKLWETRGNDLDRAFHATQVAFELDPDDGESRAEIERLAAKLGAWEDLALAYEHGLGTTQDDLTKRELLGALAKLYDERLDSPRQALDAWTRLAALDPTDPAPLEQMDTLCLLLSDWKTLVSVLEKKSELASDDDGAGLWRRIAETRLDMLEDVDGAVQAYERALELDSSSTRTVDALIALYEPKNAAQRLVELYARRVELSDPSEAELRYDLNIKAAARYEKDLESPRDAITALVAALDAKPADHAVLVALERLYRAERMWDELLENLRLQASQAAEADERVRLRKAMGELYASELLDPASALEQYELVLDEAPDDAEATAAVLQIGETRDEMRLDAAAILEPVLRAGGKHEKLVGVLELKLRALSDPADRAAALRSIAEVEDARLGRADRAEAALLRALEDTPDDAGLHAEIERLAAKVSEAEGTTAAWQRYCDALAQRAVAIFDATIAKELWVRLGRISEERLKDDQRSVEAYAKAAEVAGDTPELLEALDRLYGRIGDQKSLMDVLERRVSVVTDDREQADLLYRLASLQIASGDKAQGLGTLKQSLERAPDHADARAAVEALTDDRTLFEEAADALESVYRQSKDTKALARLYDKRVSYADSPAERVRMRLDLARVLEEESQDPKAAQSVLESALADDPTDSDVLAEIERVAAITGEWVRAADVLEKAVDAREDLTPDTAADLLMRLAGWRRDKVGDKAGSERAFEAALVHDPQNETILRAIEDLQRVPGRERDLVGTLRRLAALDALAGSAADLRREAKALAEGALADAELTEAILREMIAADDADVWATSELAKLREKAGDYKEVFALLCREAELTADAAKIQELRHAAAGVARDRLGDPAAAVQLYQQIFEDDPNDTKASGALRELYASTKRYKELAALLARLVDLADSPAARGELRLEAAKIHIEQLDSVTDAVELLRAVLDDEPANEPAALLLSQLYEKQGNDDELAELLERQIGLARDRGDVPAELTFSVRLGEVYEARLGDTAKAIETYRAVLERDRRHERALSALAKLHESRGEREEAASMLERILEIESGRASGVERAVKTALHVADLRAALGDDVGVRRALEAALAVDAKAAEVRKRLRALYEKTAAWSELADLFRSDAETATEAAEKVAFYRKAADIHVQKRQDPAAAAELLVKASELAPTDRELLLALCDAYSASGRGKQAAQVLQKIVESYGGRRSKELAVIHHRLGKAYLAEGERQKALAELDIAFKIDPGSILVLRDLGLLSLELAKAGEDTTKGLDQAQKAFRALLLQKLDEHSPINKAEVFYYLGEISHLQGDDKKAIQMLERALDNDKNLEKAKALMAELKK